MSYLIKPAGYKALLNLSQTEMGIKMIKDFFQQNLSSELQDQAEEIRAAKEELPQW